MSKVIVTGAQGFLGVRLVSYLEDKYEIKACSHSDLDITDARHVLEVFQSFQPEYVVHCAAISDTGYAQQHPDESEQINVQGTVNVAKACAEVGAKLIYMSSDQVYNGTDMIGGLSEFCPLAPASVYGQHKLAAEDGVQAVAKDAVGLRLSWMYDLPCSPYKLNRNILVNLQNAAATAQPLSVATREYRGITNVWEVIRRIPLCFELPGGIYNFGSENPYNSYETFIAIARMMKIAHPEELIIKDSERFPEHPRNLSMDLAKLRIHGFDFPDTLEGVEQALSVGE